MSLALYQLRHPARRRTDLLGVKTDAENQLGFRAVNNFVIFFVDIQYMVPLKWCDSLLSNGAGFTVLSSILRKLLLPRAHKICTV